MRIRKFILILMVLAISLTACTRMVLITENNNGETIELKQGQRLQLRLEGNITTGYSWEILNVDEQILDPRGEPEYQEESENRTGAGGVFLFQFTAKETGTTDLELGYLRPWETDTPPIENYTVTIVVQ